MGSPVSFPVLCLINIAATLVSYAIRLGVDEVDLSTIPICVNGDDVLFWAVDREHYEIWKQVTAKCGLKFSLGKNYTSRRYAVINSELYRFDGDRKVGDTNYPQPAPLFHEESCVNSRLLAGSQRSSAAGGVPYADLEDEDINILLRTKQDMSFYFPDIRGESDKATWAALKTARAQYKINDLSEDWIKFYKTVPSRYQELIGKLYADNTKAVPTMMRDMTKIFNDIQIKRVNRFAQHVPKLWTSGRPRFYLPQYLGGLGLNPFPGQAYTASDYLLARTIYSRPKGGREYVRAAIMSGKTLPFMERARAELRRLQDGLDIEQQLVTAPELEALRYHGEDESLYGLPFLSGQVDAQALTVTAYEEDLVTFSRKVTAGERHYYPLS